VCATAEIAYALAVADSKTVYRGLWWLPKDIDDKQPGTLTIDSDGSTQLDLIGGFVVTEDIPIPGAPGVSTPRHVGSYPTILGKSGSHHFTLLNTRTVRAPNGVFGRPDEHAISAWRVLRGSVFVGESEAEIFAGMKISLDYLPLFVGRSSLHHTPDWVGEPPERTDTAVSQPVEALVASWEDLTFTLKIHHDEFYFENRDPGSRTLASTERAWLEVVPDAPVALSRLDAVSGQLQNLLTLAFDHPCSINARIYRVPLPDPRNEYEAKRREYTPEYHIFEYAEQVFKPDPGEYEDRLRATYLFALHCMDFDRLIPAWFDLYTRIEPAAQLLFGLKYLERGFVPNKLMTTCAALEALHSSLYDHDHLGRADFKRLKTQAKEGVDDDLRPRLNELLHNRLDYDKRALELAQKVTPKAIEALIGDAAIWAELIKSCRNTLAHASSKHAISEQLRFCVMVLTRALLSLVIAAELGLNEDEQVRFANVYWPLASQYKQLTGQEES
jgi:hypothetical protein